MSTPEIERRRVRTVRVELPGGRIVKAGVWPGEPGEVVIRTSAPEAPPGGRTQDVLSLPATALPALRRLLAELDPEEDRRDG